MNQYDLKRDGVACIPIFPCAKEEREKLLREVRSFPEMKPGLDDKSLFNSLTSAGFSALAEASTFHNTYVRDLRLSIHETVKNYIQSQAIVDSDKYQFEQLIDRMLIRPRSRTVSKDSVHRDISPNKKSDDVIFGGWISFDEGQVFRCILGSHKDEEFAEVKEGKMNKRTAKQQVGYAKITDKNMIKEYHDRMTEIQVPPGHIIIFYENILHEVAEVKGTKSTDVMIRLFTAWRLTQSNESMNDHVALEDQAVCRIKSMQIPEYYCGLQTTEKNVQNLANKSKYFIDKCVCVITIKGTEYKVPAKKFPSLGTIGAKYPKYSPEEIAIYTPQQFN